MAVLTFGTAFKMVVMLVLYATFHGMRLLNRQLPCRELRPNFLLSSRCNDCRPQIMDREPVLIDLALQGGGSHGAFTWGVLDRLLEESWLQIEAISGTSAGAMNAAVLADGWTEGGAAGARDALDAYWQRVSKAAAMSPLQR